MGAVAFGLQVKEETLGKMLFVFNENDEWGGGFRVMMFPGLDLFCN